MIRKVGPITLRTSGAFGTVLFRSIRVRFGIFDTIKIQKKSDKLRKNYCRNKIKMAVTRDNELNEIVQYSNTPRPVTALLPGLPPTFLPSRLVILTHPPLLNGSPIFLKIYCSFLCPCTPFETPTTWPLLYAILHFNPKLRWKKNWTMLYLYIPSLSTFLAVSWPSHGPQDTFLKVVWQRKCDSMGGVAIPNAPDVPLWSAPHFSLSII
jgi:hypothetical protein